MKASGMVIIQQASSHLNDCPFDKFPVEVFFHCLKFMPLESLILCRTVCKEWRHLVLAYADKEPDRRRLLELFESIAKTSLPMPCFRPHFDRKAYMDELLAQKPEPVIPEAFRLWVLEWPAYAVRVHQWPDNPPVVFIHSPDLIQLPHLQSIRLLSIQEVTRHYAFHNTWLILDEDPQNFGRVLVSRRTYDDEKLSDEPEDSGDDPKAQYKVDSQVEIYDDWIHYQKTLWEQGDGFERIPIPDLTEYSSDSYSD
ncbi:hypothetical protein CPB84DRAFT_1787025 [Gymnopilus junonius]|uniref:F-box domain-containing protein n=1 Tax=Gymnopilus junonius TaxID=109634 RepID=A0A9P5NGR6_GYMJU|nr:hypothetical protein CPB84DRAFT_1787025 [Gymnopilus junonius]